MHVRAYLPVNADRPVLYNELDLAAVQCAVKAVPEDELHGLLHPLLAVAGARRVRPTMLRRHPVVSALRGFRFHRLVVFLFNWVFSSLLQWLVFFKNETYSE